MEQIIAEGMAVFDTAMGWCAVAWRGDGVVRVHLPEPTEREARVAIQRRLATVPEAEPPASVQVAIDAIRRLLHGERTDLSAVAVNLADRPAFDRAVYEVVRTIPAGETTTYGAVAERLGHRDAARDVGQALARNPVPIVVPCHRVLAAHGRLGGFSARGGTATKRRLLAVEGAVVNDPEPLFDVDSALA